MGVGLRLGAATAAFFLTVFALANCGGGGGSAPVTGTITPAPLLRTDLLFGYYGDCPTCAMETHDHVNLYWAGNWGGLASTEQSLFNARAAGITNIVLAVPAYDANAELDTRYYLTQLQQAGFLTGIRALYPIDEPDRYVTADQVIVTNAMLRRVMADYPELAATKLAVIYSPAGTFPGIASYDWVGFDDYDRGCAALAGEYQAMKARLRADQRILVVPGGSDPWRQDPACFSSKANADAQVVAIVPFKWFSGAPLQPATKPDGIRDNPTRKLYCELGRQVVGNPAPC